jgi:hypothetical protein
MPRAHYYEYFTDTAGNVMNGASVRVENETGGTLIGETIYAAETGASTQANPITAGSRGEIEIWLTSPKRVTLVASKAGYATVTQIVDVTLPAAQPFNVMDYGAKGDGTTDDSAAIQAAVDAVGTTGGVVFFPAGKTYLLNTASILLPRANTRLMVLSGYGATLKLSTTVTTAIDWHRIADHDLFTLFTLEGFTIDVDNKGTAANVAVIGSNVQRANITRIDVRDIRTINVPLAGDGSHTRRNIWFFSYQLNNGEATENYITDILIERCRMEGGDWGVAVIGGNNGTTNVDTHVRLDNITIRDCWHSTQSIPTGFVGACNYHIGSEGWGNRCLIDNCYGYGCGDCGIEVDNMEHAVVRDCLEEEAWTTCYYYSNYNNNYSVSEQMVLFDNCHAVRNSAAQGNGFDVSVNRTLPLHQVVYNNCSYTSSLSTTTTSNALYIYDDAALDRVVIRNFLCTLAGFTYSSSSQGTIYGLYLAAANTVVEMDNVYVKISGARSGSGVLYVIPVCLSLTGAASVVSLRNIDVAVDVTGLSNGSICGLKTARANGNYIRGTIDRFKVISMTGDAAPMGIHVPPSTMVTITDRLYIRDCDFSAMAAGTEIYIQDATNQALVVFDRNQWMTWPPAPIAITPGSSPYAYRNLDSYPEEVVVSGGTVSAIDISRNGSTYYATGETAGIFHLEPDDYLKVTYSSTPTMTKIPAV